MKANFISRTGREGSVNVAEKIESLLAEAGKLPRRTIPRSNLNRLLSSDNLRRRIGFTVSRGDLKFTHQKPAVLHAMQRIASDLSEGKLTLDQIWNNADKHEYLDKLAHQRALPTQDHLLPNEQPAPRHATKPNPAARPSSVARPQQRDTLIPAKDFSIAWPVELHRVHAIWEELQFRLSLS